MKKDISNAHKSILSGMYKPDDRSFGVYNMLSSVYPAFAKKLFEGNKIMYALVMTGQNPMDILDYPICGSCETLAPFDGTGVKNGKRVLRCTCMRCHRSTVAPVTLRTWARYELKKKMPPEFMDALECATDLVLANMLLKYQKETDFEIAKKNKKELGDTGKYGNLTKDVPIVTHHGDTVPEELKDVDFTTDEEDFEDV